MDITNRSEIQKIDFLISEVQNEVLGMDTVIALQISITPIVAIIKNRSQKIAYATEEKYLKKKS